MASSVQEAFSSQKIIPAIIPEAPPKLLKITYENNVEVNLGNKLQPRQVRVEPKYEWDADSNSMYSLIFVDPDAPSSGKPFLGEIVHHIVINIKGGDVSSGKVCGTYKGSAPPPMTSHHRYIFLVYKQNDGEIGDFALKSKSKFKTLDFSTKYNLTLEAGNFYLAAYDSSVLGTWCKMLIGK